MNFLSTIADWLKSHAGDQKTGWGRWIGALLIIDIFGVWTYTCIWLKKDVVALDATLLSIVLTIFLVEAVKSVFAPPPVPATEVPVVVTPAPAPFPAPVAPLPQPAPPINVPGPGISPTSTPAPVVSAPISPTGNPPPAPPPATSLPTG